MNLKQTLELYAGGPGSGCQGENCGRPRGSSDAAREKSIDGTLNLAGFLYEDTIAGYKVYKKGRDEISIDSNQKWSLRTTDIGVRTGKGMESLAIALGVAVPGKGMKLKAGGAGSHCNPERGPCGRRPKSLKSKNMNADAVLKEAEDMYGDSAAFKMMMVREIRDAYPGKELAGYGDLTLGQKKVIAQRCHAKAQDRARVRKKG